MKYMGDHPSKQSRVGNELTDEIFEPALKHVCTTVYFLDLLHITKQHILGQPCELLVLMTHHLCQSFN